MGLAGARWNHDDHEPLILFVVKAERLYLDILDLPRLSHERPTLARIHLRVPVNQSRYQKTRVRQKRLQAISGQSATHPFRRPTASVGLKDGGLGACTR